MPSSAGRVPIDSGLVEVLPAEVGGLALDEWPETEALLAADPALAETAEAFATAFAIDPSDDEFVHAIVIRLRDGRMGEERFRDWRDSYDEEACLQAGGVVGNAQAEVDGRTVYIGTCDQGVRTYHVWLEEQSLLISASSLGDDKRLGEELVENLRP